MPYNDDGEKIANPGMMEIKIERGGENVNVEVPEGATIKALIEDGHLRGIGVVNTRLNGVPAQEDMSLHSGDIVAAVPKSGEQNV